MLVKCSECQKEVSSEAASCPHCGCPIKPPPKDMDIPIVREANPAKSGLGTFFIVLAILGVIIGFIVVQPSDIERSQQRIVDTQNEVDYPDQGAAQEQLDKMQSDRHFEASCFFVPSGILFVLGLVLKSSAKPNA